MLRAMKLVERHGKIVEYLKRGGEVTVVELSREFGVSDMTVRRDLEKLEKTGILYRTYGGARLASNIGFEVPYALRRTEHQEEKRLIGRAAAGLIEQNDVIFLDVGSTCGQIASHIGASKRLTVLTNWIPNVLTLLKKKDITVVLIGGILRHDEMSLTDSFAEEMLKQFYIDKAFLGVSAICANRGITDYDYGEVRIKREVIAQAREVIVVVDHSKFGKTALLKIAPITQVHHVITGVEAPPEELAALRAMGIRVTVVGDSGEEGLREIGHSGGEQ